MENNNKFKRLSSRILNSNTLLESSDNYTVTFDNRDIYITGEITNHGIQVAIETINSINKADNFESRNFAVLNSEYNAPPINIYINSIGGDAMAALGLITTIESSETEIHTHCLGEASSAALLIFAVGHQRFAYKHSIFMYHQLSTMALGTFKDIEDTVEVIKHLQERLEEIFLIYTNFSEEELAEIRQSKRDHTFYYQEALDKGLADKVIINAVYSKDLENLKDNTNISITSTDGELMDSTSSESDNDIEILETTESVVDPTPKFINMSYPEAVNILLFKCEEGSLISRTAWDEEGNKFIYKSGTSILMDDGQHDSLFIPADEDLIAKDYYLSL